MNGTSKLKNTSKNRTNPVFVYGTLRKGYHNHDLLKHADFQGTFHTGPGYQKIVKGLPYLIETDDGPGCEGELYLVTDLTLDLLDRLEGSPDWYVRTKIKLNDGTEAWCYLMPKERI